MIRLLFLALICCPLCGMQLVERLQEARPGDYLVMAICRTNSVLRVLENSQETLSLDEIIAPDGMNPAQTSWKEWVLQGAPGKLAWRHYTIDLRSGRLLHAQMLKGGQWFADSQTESFLSTLLSLPFETVPLRERKRVGPKPTGGQDLRPLWAPKVKYEGTVVPSPQFEVWKARWPRDGSELSGKAIDVYLPAANGMLPSYFPFSIQVTGTMGKGRIQVIDSGRGLLP